MRPAEQPAVDGRRWAALPARDHVIDLQHRGRPADPTIGQLPLAPSLVPLHHVALHLGRDAGAPFRLLLDERLERQLQDLLVGGAGLLVRFPRLRPLQEGEELAGDRDVQAALGCRHRLRPPAGRFEFTQVTFLARVGPGHVGPLPAAPVHGMGPAPPWSPPSSRHHCHGSISAATSWPPAREPVGTSAAPLRGSPPSSRCQDRRGGEAEPPVLGSAPHLREPHQQPGDRSRWWAAPRQPRGAVLVEVVEERCVSEDPVEPAPVEVARFRAGRRPARRTPRGGGRRGACEKEPGVEGSEVSFMHPLSHAIFGPPGTLEDGRPRVPRRDDLEPRRRFQKPEHAANAQRQGPSRATAREKPIFTETLSMQRFLTPQLAARSARRTMVDGAYATGTTRLPPARATDSPPR